MGSKTQTSTTSSQPNPQVLANYNTLLGAATDIATRPYNYYGGQLTAGMNDTQNYGLSTANQAGIPIQESLNTSGAVNSAASTLFNNAAGFTNNVAPYYQAASGAAQTGLGTLGGASGAVSGGLGTLGGALNGLGSTVGVSMPTYSAGMNNLAMAGTTYGNALNALGGIGQMGQAYIDGGSNLAYQGAGTVSPTQFSSDALQPFLYAGQQNLVDATMANVRQNNATQQNDVITNAIKSGNAFGGDRMGVAQAELARQQDLATNQTLQSLNQANYSQAVSGFQNQRDANVAAQENNYARQLQAASTLGNLGTASVNAQLAPLQASLQAASGLASTGVAQGNLGSSYQASMMAPYTAMAGIGGQQTSAGSALSGIGGQQLSGGQTLSGIGTATLGSYLQPTQAQISALGTQLSAGQQSLGASSALLGQSGAQLAGGQVQQQTEQNALTNAYNQFLLSQQYPFQTGSWLTGIAAGLGSGLGGTSSTTSPGPSLLGQIAGIGLAGASLFKKDGGRIPTRATGGRVGSLGSLPHFASGGGAAMPGIGMDPSGLPYSGLAQIQIVPAYSGPRASGVGIPNAPAIAVQTNPFANLATGSSVSNAQLQGLSNIGSKPDLGSTVSNGVSSAVGFNPFNGFRRGGMVSRRPSGGLGRVASHTYGGRTGTLGNLALAHYDDGGAVEDGLENIPMAEDGPVLDRSVLGGVPTSFAALGPASDGAAAIPPSYVSRVVHVESRGDPNAVSSTGAKGLGQFTAGTARAVGLADPFDPEASKAAIARLAASNRDALRDRIGRDPTEEELYAAHQQGAGGAAALINNPTARAGDVLGDRAVRVNGGDPNMPARDFLAKVKSLYSGVPEPTTTGSLGDVGSFSANSNGSGLGNVKIAEPSVKQAMLAAGLAMMASRSPFALQAIGEGGLQGLANYRQQQEAASKVANTQSDIDNRAGTLDVARKDLMFRSKEAAAKLKLEQQKTDQAGRVTDASVGLTGVETALKRFPRITLPNGQVVMDMLSPFSAPKVLPYDLASPPTSTDPAVSPPASAGAPTPAEPSAAIATGAPSSPAPAAPATSAAPVAPTASPGADAPRPYVDEFGQTIAPPSTRPSADAAPVPPAAPASAAPRAQAPLAPTPDRPAAGVRPAVTTVPKGYQPPGFLYQRMSPDEAKVNAELAPKIIQEAQADASAAQSSAYLLQEMKEASRSIPTSGFGANAQARQDFAKTANTYLGRLGLQPFDPDVLASGELLNKAQFRLGAELAKSMGGREPGFIVQSAVGANPSLENTKIGFTRLIASLEQAQQRKIDLANFVQDWRSKYGVVGLSDAANQFNMLNPPQSYVDRALVSAVDPRDAKTLRANADNSDARTKFDKLYGKGVSTLVLGR